MLNLKVCYCLKSLIRINDHKLAEFLEFNATRLVLVHFSHDRLELLLLDKDLQLGEHTSQLVQRNLSSIIFVEGSEHISEHELLLLVVWNGQQSLSHQLYDLHHWVHLNWRVGLLHKAPVLLLVLHESLVVRNDHWNLSVDLQELVEWNFSLELSALGFIEGVKSHCYCILIHQIVSEDLSCDLSGTARVQLGPELLNHGNLSGAHFLVSELAAEFRVAYLPILVQIVVLVEGLQVCKLWE